jgi:SAM-dependent methyltransferase
MSGRALAESFDHEAAHYERGRPSWPADVLDVLPLEGCGTVVDLGAGTGKLTRLLVRRFERVIAVEPLEGMRSVLSRLVPEAEALAGSAEEIPLGDGTIDAVFCAEAFHWFDGDRALAEITRVLRSRGLLVLLWNIQTAPTEPSIATAAEIVNERGDPRRQIARYESGEWRESFHDEPFEELRSLTLEHVQNLDREAMLSHLLSMSWIAVLPGTELEQLERDLRPLLDADEYGRPFRSDVYWTRLRR